MSLNTEEEKKNNASISNSPFAWKTQYAEAIHPEIPGHMQHYVIKYKTGKYFSVTYKTFKVNKA